MLHRTRLIIIVVIILALLATTAIADQDKYGHDEYNIDDYSLPFENTDSVTAFNNALAYKIPLINPVTPLQRHGDIYYYPSSIATFVTQASQPEYYYLKVDNDERACFTSAQSGLTQLDPKIVTVDFNGTRINLHCYCADPNYFSFQ